MTKNIFHQSVNDLDNDPGDNERTITLEMIGPLVNQPVEDELEVQVELAETTPASSQVPLVEPAKRPWWQRFFEYLFRRQALETIEVEAVPVVEAVPPSPAAPLPLEEETPETVTEEIIPVPEEMLPKPEQVPPATPAPSPSVSLGTNSVQGPAFTLDDVRALVQEELGRVQEDVHRMVQAELTRERHDRRHTSHSALQEVADNILEDRVGLLGTELKLLCDEEQRTLQDSNMPLRERMALVDFIRERRIKTKEQIAEAEAALAQHIAETDQALTELEGYSAVTSLREELERQKQGLTGIETRLTLPFGRLTVPWTILLVLLVVAVGVAGILLPRQTGPAPTTLIEMATLYQASGKVEEAIRVLDEALEAGVRDVETLGQVGQTYYALQEYEKAIVVLEQVIEKDPQNSSYGLILARSYGEMGQRQQAIAQYERLIESDPGNWGYYLEMGQQYEALQDYDQALVQYQKVAELAPERIEGHASQGRLYRSLERYDEAIEQYQGTLEINPNAWWIRVMLGQSYTGLQNWDRAIEQFRAAAELAPDNPSPYLEMGKVWRAQGEYEQALSQYQDALDIRSDYVPAFLEMGGTYMELEDCEQATLWFLRVLEEWPNNQVAQDGLGACQGE